MYRAGTYRNAVTESVVGPLGQDLFLVHAACLAAVQAHLHVDLLIAELALDNFIQFVVVIAEHVDHDGVLGASQQSDQDPMNVIPRSEEGPLIVGISVQETAFSLVAGPVLPREWRLSHRAPSRFLPMVPHLHVAGEVGARY